MSFSSMNGKRQMLFSYEELKVANKDFTNKIEFHGPDFVHKVHR